MNRDQRSLDSIFLDALEKESDSERSAYLDEVCGSDRTLRLRVERFLATQPKVRDFLEAPAACLPATIDPTMAEGPGAMIGPYKLIEQIGEGGMGLVFAAEQKHPVRRKVALKLIKPGMDSKQVIRRFEAERQALALMDHPNIAKFLDAGMTGGSGSGQGAGGTEAVGSGQSAVSSDKISSAMPSTSDRQLPLPTATGRPYFVMELVHGIAITDYCDQARFTIRERLALFVLVCRAVQHAHTKGIIHRDLKPGNVLVTSNDGVPVPKIIDFGVAKALHESLTERTLHTGFAQMIGTPLYMSPEQAEFNQTGVDTRSDIYSLGVLLYELLTGTTPLDKERLRQSAFGEVLRLIREEEPPRPSTYVSTLGANLETVSERRGADPRKLSEMLHSELDWIILKALDKDRARRYETASVFAADVQRYLNDEQVEACPPSRRYVLGKFLRRHRTGVLTTVALLAAALVLGASISWVALDRATRQTETDRQRTVTEQAVFDDLKEAEIWQQQEQWAKTVQALERAKGRVEESGPGPLRARVKERLRDVALVVRLQEARLKASVGVSVGKSVVGGRLYAAVFAELGLDVASPDVENTARQIRASAIRNQLVAALDHWALGKHALPGGDGTSLRTLVQMADVDPWRQQVRNHWAAKDQEALISLAEAEDVLTQPPANLLLLSDLLDNPGTRTDRAASKTTIATRMQLLRRAQMRYPADFWINQALSVSLGLQSIQTNYWAAAIGYSRATLALQPQYPELHLIHGNHLWGQKNLSEAVVAYHMAIELQPDFPDAYLNLGSVLRDQRKWPEAVAAYRKAIKLQPNFPEAYFELGGVLAKQSKFAEAEAAFRKGLKLNPQYAEAYNNLGLALRSQDKFSDAEAAFLEAIKLNDKSAEAHSNLGIALEAQGKFPEAVVAYRKAIELEPDAAIPHVNIGINLGRQGKFSEAEAALRKAIKLQPDSADAYDNLGVVLFNQDKLAEAETAYRKAIELQPDYANAHFNLGLALRDQGQFADAVVSLKRAQELHSPIPVLPLKIRQAEQFVAFDAKLPKILKGEIQPADTAERLALARFCGLPCRRFNAAAARFYSEAFAAEPKQADDLDSYNRYAAACVAALAGCGQGNDAANLEPKVSIRLRGQALAWLRADLTAWQIMLKKQPDQVRSIVQQTMGHWQQDSDFAGVRGDQALAKLPEAERHEWRKLWEEVAELERRAAASQPQ